MSKVAVNIIRAFIIHLYHHEIGLTSSCRSYYIYIRYFLLINIFTDIVSRNTQLTIYITNIIQFLKWSNGLYPSMHNISYLNFYHVQYKAWANHSLIIAAGNRRHFGIYVRIERILILNHWRHNQTCNCKSLKNNQ